VGVNWDRERWLDPPDDPPEYEYRVTVRRTRTVEEVVTITVEAEDEKQAQDDAITHAKDASLCWVEDSEDTEYTIVERDGPPTGEP